MVMLFRSYWGTNAALLLTVRLSMIILGIISIVIICIIRIIIIISISIIGIIIIISIVIMKLTLFVILFVLLFRKSSNAKTSLTQAVFAILGR